MLIRVLGPVDVLDDEGDGVGVGGPLQIRLLVLLVVAGSDRLSVDEAMEVGGFSIPARAAPGQVLGCFSFITA